LPTSHPSVTALYLLVRCQSNALDDVARRRSREPTEWEVNVSPASPLQRKLGRFRLTAGTTKWARSGRAGIRGFPAARADADPALGEAPDGGVERVLREAIKATLGAEVLLCGALARRALAEKAFGA
jgi:hypothetical protein